MSEKTSGETNPSQPSPIEGINTAIDMVRGLGKDADRMMPPILRAQTLSSLRKPTSESLNATSVNVATFWKSQYDSALVKIAEQGQDATTDVKVSTAMLMSSFLAVSIDKTKVKSFGQSATTNASNRLIYNAFQQFAFLFASENYSELTEHRSALWRGNGLARTLMSDEKRSWHGVKMLSFLSHAEQALNIMGIIESQPMLSEQETAQLKSENDELFDLSRRLQKYGVKPAVIPSTGLIKEWKVAPSQQVADELLKLNTGEFAVNVPGRYDVALFSATDGKFADSITSTEDIRGATEGVAASGIAAGIDSSVPYKIFSCIYLSRAGNLTSMNGYSLEKFCKENFAEAAYESLRAELIAYYFDLVTPLFVQGLVQQEADSVAPVSTQHQESREAKFRRLNLARRTVIYELGDDIEEYIALEIEEAQKDTAKRAMAIHPVIGHVRKIAPDFRASKEARELCFNDLGLVLADYGETYVRDHKRGNVEKDTRGHRATFSPESQASKLRRTA